MIWWSMLALKPKLVLTDHGFCEEFARKLNKLGLMQKQLSTIVNKALTIFSHLNYFKNFSNRF